MQGKIALEEHFAIEATLSDFAGVRLARVAGAAPPPDRHPGDAARRNGQTRHRDDDPVAQRPRGAGDPRRKARHRSRQRGKRRARRERRQAPGAFCRLCRAADAGSGSRRRRARALRQAVRLCRRAGQRLQSSRLARHRPLLRCAAIPAVLARGGSARRAVLSASRAIRCRAGPNSTRAIPGCSAPIGPSRQKRPCTRCG